MQLKIRQPKGVTVTLNSTEKGRLQAAADLANRLGDLPCYQAETAMVASQAIDALLEALEPVGEPKE